MQLQTLKCRGDAEKHKTTVHILQALCSFIMGSTKTCRVFNSLIRKRDWMKNLKNWMIRLILLTNKKGIGLCEKTPRSQRRLNLDKDSDTGWAWL